MSFYDATQYDPEEIIDGNRELAEDDTAFVGPDLEVDAEQSAQTAKDEYARRNPGWQPRPADPATTMLDAVGLLYATLARRMVTIPFNAVVATHATEIQGIPRRAAVPAIAQAVWTAKDVAGYTADAYDRVTLKRTGSEGVTFEVIRTTAIPPGERSATVEMRAVTPGTAGNDLSGPAEPANWPDWLEGIEVPVPSGFGLDAEDEDEFARKVKNLLGQPRRPTRPQDFSGVMQNLVPAMANARIVAMDGYNPETLTWGNEATMTMLVSDLYGEPFPPEIKNAAVAILAEQCVYGWRNFVIDFDYEVVDVSYRVTAFHGQNPDTVLAICDSAVAQLVSPRWWRLGSMSPGIGAGEVIPPPQLGGEPLRQTIGRGDVIARLDYCRGVDRVDVDSILLNGEPADLTLRSLRTLPRPGVITGEVIAG